MTKSAVSVFYKPLRLLSCVNSVFLFICCLTSGISFSFSQTGHNICKDYRKLSRPEKCWIISHPFAAKRAWKITLHAISIGEEIKKDTLLDGDMAGGQADAFRHAFWMATLCREIHWRKALKLGKAHERGNKIEFKKGKTEDGILQDKAGMDMDLFNNQYGILLGKQYKRILEEELVTMIKMGIMNGELKVIKKDLQGNSLDADGKIISDWVGNWVNKRVLVRSDILLVQKGE